MRFGKKILHRGVWRVSGVWAVSLDSVPRGEALIYIKIYMVFKVKGYERKDGRP
jgi:hypothetical protein